MGGKGRVYRKTPLEIEEICNQRSINGTPRIYASRMSAKVDSAAVQDGYQIYHHRGAIEKARIGDREKVEAIQRLKCFTNISHRA